MGDGGPMAEWARESKSRSFTSFRMTPVRSGNRRADENAADERRADYTRADESRRCADPPLKKRKGGAPARAKRLVASLCRDDNERRRTKNGDFAYFDV
jgi:hypothetical protein